MLPVDRFVVSFILNLAHYRLLSTAFRSIYSSPTRLLVRSPLAHFYWVLNKIGQMIAAAAAVVIIEHRFVSTAQVSAKKRYSIYLKHGMCFTNSVDSCQVESTIIADVCMCVRVCLRLLFYPSCCCCVLRTAILYNILLLHTNTHTYNTHNAQQDSTSFAA